VLFTHHLVVFENHVVEVASRRGQGDDPDGGDDGLRLEVGAVVTQRVADRHVPLYGDRRQRQHGHKHGHSLKSFKTAHAQIKSVRLKWL